MRFVKPKLYEFENQLYHYVKEWKKLRLFEKLYQCISCEKPWLMNVYENYTKKKKLVVIFLYKTISVTL